MCNHIIIAPKGCKYLSDIEGFNELPVNCLFNKGRTGCGGTEVVLRGEKNAIIAVPYISLIINKIESNTEHEDRSDVILGVHGEVTSEEITSYLKNHEIKKIMVTYDSVPRLVKIIQGVDGNEGKVFEDYFLLVDEWHCLFKYYDFRTEAIRNLLPVARKFKEVTFMTATPVHPNFIFDELKTYPIVEVEWEEKTEINVQLYQTFKPIAILCRFIEYVKGKAPQQNFHIFMNSVEMITSFLLEYKDCNPDLVKIVCSMNNSENQLKLSRVNPNYIIAKAGDPARKNNLYTSTAFEGCDIHDENGLNIVICNGHKEHTLLDIKTTVPQICGRVRNSIHQREFYYIFSINQQSNPTPYLKYVEILKKDFKENNDYVMDMNNMTPEHRERTITLIKKSNPKSALAKYLITGEDHNLRLDKNMLLVDIYNHYIFNFAYKSKENLKQEFEACKYNISRCVMFVIKEKSSSDKLSENSDAKICWKELFEEYHALKEPKDDGLGFMKLLFQDQCQIIEDYKPLVKEAYNKLGIEKIRELDYQRRAIEKELVKRENLPNIVKIMDQLECKISLGKLYTVQALNDMIQKICDEYDLQKVPATKIDDYFECENTTSTINEKNTRCKTIYSRKLIAYQ